MLPTDAGETIRSQHLGSSSGNLTTIALTGGFAPESEQPGKHLEHQ